MATKKIVWVERMTISTLLLLVFRKLFSNFEMRFDQQQCSLGLASFISRLQKKIPSVEFFPANLSLAKKNFEGCALIYDVNINLNCCLSSFCKKYIPTEAKWFKQMLKSYLSTSLLHRMLFITMVEAEISRETDAEHELFLERHMLNRLIRDFYEERGFKINQSLSLLSYMRIAATPFALVVLNLMNRLIGSKVKTNIKKIRPAIWVEYHQTELTGFLCFSFWRDNITKTGYDLVYFLDRADTELSKEREKLEAPEDRHLWIDCHNIWRFVRLGHRDVFKILRSFVIINLNQPLWLHFFKIEYSILFHLYRSLFAKYKVKIIIQHREALWRQAILAQAVEAVGGIMLGFNWSNYHWTTISTHLYPQHVFFVWGKMQSEYLRKRGNTCKYILPSGLWIKKSDLVDKQLADLEGYGGFKIAIFDSSVDYKSQHSPESLSLFLLRIIGLLETNHEWHAIVKSKKFYYGGRSRKFYFTDYREKPEGEQIVARLKKLNNQKRLIILDPDESPVTAASYADLSVCYGLNTAGILAALNGIPAIHWDCAGWLKFPLYKNAGQQVLYATLDELEQAIIKASQGDKTIGDLSFWRRQINYLGDDGAPGRVGKFIDDYMSEIIKTGNAEKSMDLAASKYIDVNGIGEDFFEETEIYGPEQAI